MNQPDWQPWALGNVFDPECGGHSFCEHGSALTDFKLKSEKAYYATYKYQVVHRHAHGDRCGNECTAFGHQVPRLEAQT